VSAAIADPITNLFFDALPRASSALHCELPHADKNETVACGLG
jgi:hypothetical protein